MYKKIRYKLGVSVSLTPLPALADWGIGNKPDNNYSSNGSESSDEWVILFSAEKKSKKRKQLFSYSVCLTKKKQIKMFF